MSFSTTFPIFPNLLVLGKNSFMAILCICSMSHNQWEHVLFYSLFFCVSSFFVWSSQCLLISFSQGHIFRLLTLSQFSFKLIHENMLIKSFRVVILVLRFAYFMCTYVCYVYVCSMCLSFSRDARRGHKTRCELLCRYWDLNQVRCKCS